MATRDELIRVGVRLLEQDGLDALTLRRIAATAGVSHGAPRHHFPTYGALLAAVARTGIEDLDQELQSCFAQPDPRRLVAEAAVVYVDFARHRPEMFVLIHRHDLLGGQGENLRLVTGSWTRRLGDAVAMIAGSADVEALTAAVWSGVHGVAVLASRRTMEPTGLHTAPQSVLDVLLDALLGPRPVN